MEEKVEKKEGGVKQGDKKEGEEGGEMKQTTEVKRHSFEILKLVKEAQNQHGLRHGSYSNYREYCSRRLRRIRHALNFKSHRNDKKKVKYVKREVSGELVKEKKEYLLLPLVGAERGWAHAMELKESKEGERVKFHVRRRLAKAASLSNQLFLLSQSSCDERTQLEAQAYLFWMEATSSLENNKWSEALSFYNKSLSLFSQFSKLEDPLLRQICQEKISVIEPSIRFCNYKLQTSNSSPSSLPPLSFPSSPNKTQMKGELKEGSKGESKEEKLGESVLLRGGESVLLREGESVLLREGESDTQLKSILEQARLEEAHSIKEVNYKGSSIPLKSEKLKASILKIRQIGLEIERQTSLIEKLRLYDSLFLAYDEASQAVDSSFQNAPNSKKKQQQANKKKKEGDKKEEKEGKGISSQREKQLRSYLEVGRLEETVKRNEALVELGEKRVKGVRDFDTLHPLCPSFLGVHSKPFDLSKLFSTLSLNLNHLKSFLLPQEEEELKLLSSKQLHFDSLLHFWLSRHFEEKKEWSKALSLLNHSQSLLNASSQLLHSSSTPPPLLFKALNSLSQTIRSQKCSLRANFFLYSQTNQTHQTNQTTFVKGEAAEEVPLTQKLDTFHIFEANSLLLSVEEEEGRVEGRVEGAKSEEKEKLLIIGIPPSPSPLPSKPVLFDLALASCNFPSLEERKRKKTFWSSWFG